MSRLLLVAYLLEVGLLLILVPWYYPAFWDRNYFVRALPWLEGVIANNFVRGAVSGIGVINVCAGLVELGGLLLGRHAGGDPAGEAGRAGG